MIQYLNKYKELELKIKQETKILQKLEESVNKSQKDYNDNQLNIDTIIKEKKELKKSIEQIINTKLTKINKYLKIFSIISTILITGTFTILSNFDIGIIFTSFLSSILNCTYINIAIIAIMERIYNNKSIEINKIKELIKDKEIELNEFEIKKRQLFNKRVNATIKYNNQKTKIENIITSINQIKIDYATSIFDQAENITPNNTKILTRTKN